jgi:hypothetical protein
MIRGVQYDTYGKICTEMFLVNVRSMYVLPRVVDAEIMQSKLNLDFIKFTKASSRCELSSRARFFDFCLYFLYM